MPRRRKCVCGCGAALPTGPGRWRYASPECRERAIAAKAAKAGGDGGSPADPSLPSSPSRLSGQAYTDSQAPGSSGREGPGRRPKPTLGEIRTSVSGYSHTYLPDHPLAVKGWVGLNRARHYEATNGACVCGATGEPLEWADANVLEQDGQLFAVCPRHRQIRYLWLVLRTRPSWPAELQDFLQAWWVEPCGPLVSTTPQTEVPNDGS